MKKLFLSAFLFVTVLANASGINNIDKRAVENFESSYGGASNVIWTAGANFTKASFTQDQQKIEVFYDLEGDYLTTTTEISMNELPTAVKRRFAKKYADYTVQQVYKFEGLSEEDYFISAQNDEQDLVLSVTKGSFSTYSKAARN